MSKTSIIADIVAEVDGNFSLKLAPGKYIVDYKNKNRNKFGTKNLPQNISITVGSTINIGINIDTGIR